MELFSLPRWVIFGGLIGVLVVTGGIVFIPVPGAAIYFVCLIAGQLAGSVLLDHVGAFKFSVRKFSFTKTAGILITFGGVLIVNFGN